MSKSESPVVVSGAGGRMGREVSCLLEGERRGGIVKVYRDGLEASEGLVSLEQQSGLLSGAGLWIDFSEARAVDLHVSLAGKYSIPYLVGVTGLSRSSLGKAAALASKVPVMVAPNTSPGAALLRLLAARLAELSERFSDPDFEIVERHHSAKRDAPSGTALALAAVLMKSSRRKLKPVSGPTGPGARDPLRIGVHSLRSGSSAGEHTLLAASEGESLELSHKVEARSVFAAGAVEAGFWLREQPAGNYSFEDYLLSGGRRRPNP